MIYDAEIDLYYDDRRHKYIDGQTGAVLPSVTQIINILEPDKYGGIDADVLARAAAYGNKIHAIVELMAAGDEAEAYATVNTPEELHAAEAARKLLKEHIHGVVTSEKMIRNGNHYAGRYDLLTNNGALLIDIKTTSRLDRSALYWQLGLYAACFEVRPKTAVLWLPKRGKPTFEIMEAATPEEVEALVFRYEINIAE